MKFANINIRIGPRQLIMTIISRLNEKRSLIGIIFILLSFLEYIFAIAMDQSGDIGGDNSDSTFILSLFVMASAFLVSGSILLASDRGGIEQ